MIKPLNNMCFLIEDIRDEMTTAPTLRDAGFQTSDVHQKNLGVAGTIYAVGANALGLKPGMHVLYSLYIAEQIEVKDEDGQYIKNLRSVPLDAILAII